MDEVRYPDGITIAQIRGLAEIEEWQVTEALVWAGRESETHKSSLLLTMHRYGGLLLAAREVGGGMVGILLGFPGIKNGEHMHCSHQLGIVPAWRNKHLGYRMKCCQRQFVLGQGMGLIQWTFDPLETRNAFLNLHRLGGVAYEYHEDLYGVMDDELNKELASDRLTLSWHLRHPLTEARLVGQHPAPSLAALRAAGVPAAARTESAVLPSGEPYVRCVAVTAGLRAPRLLLEVPANFQAVKAECREEARAWRQGVRAVLSDLFTRGYAVLDLLVENDRGSPPRCHYLIGSLAEFRRAGEESSLAGLPEKGNPDGH